jgi:hypothetical protein
MFSRRQRLSVSWRRLCTRLRQRNNEQKPQCGKAAEALRVVVSLSCLHAMNLRAGCTTMDAYIVPDGDCWVPLFALHLRDGRKAQKTMVVLTICPQAVMASDDSFNSVSAGAAHICPKTLTGFCGRPKRMEESRSTDDKRRCNMVAEPQGPSPQRAGGE